MKIRMQIVFKRRKIRNEHEYGTEQRCKRTKARIQENPKFEYQSNVRRNGSLSVLSRMNSRNKADILIALGGLTQWCHPAIFYYYDNKRTTDPFY